MFGIGSSSTGRSRVGSEVSTKSGRKQNDDDATSKRRRSRAESTVSSSSTKHKPSHTDQSQRDNGLDRGFDDVDREKRRSSRRESKTSIKSERKRTLDEDDQNHKGSARSDSDERRRRSSRKSSSKSERKESERALSEHDAALPQNQFFSEPDTYTAPYRPPGHAADYYGDQGESVQFQPGVRPNPPPFVVNAEQAHLQTPSTEARPPQEPSSMGQLGASAAFYSMQSSGDESAHQSTPSRPSKMTDKPDKYDTSGSHQRASPLPSGKPSNSGPGLNSFGAAAMGGALGAAADYYGDSHQPAGNQYATSSGPNYNTQFSHGDTGDRPGHQTYPPRLDRPPSESHRYGTAAAMGLAGAAAGAYYAGHHNQNGNQSSRPHPSFVVGYNQSAFPSMQQQRRHKHRGPITKFVDWFRDPAGVAEFEEWSEYVGVCKDCFDPNSSPADAPRRHHHHLRRKASAGGRKGNSLRVDKKYRYSSDEDSKQRSSTVKTLAGVGLAGLGAAKVGEALYKSKHDFDDTYSVQSGRPYNTMGSSTSHGEVSHRVRESESRRTEDPRLERRESGRKSRKESKSYEHAPSRKRRGSSSSEKGLSRGAAMSVGAGAAGLAIAAEAAHRRRSRSRSRSPPKRKYYSKRVSPRHSYVDLTSTTEGQTGFGSFFSSPSANKRRGKSSKGLFKFSNASSSSSDADLAFGEGTVRRKNSMKLKRDAKTKRAEDGGIGDTAAILGLAATGVALAAESDRRKEKGKSKHYTNTQPVGDSARHRTDTIAMHDHETTSDAENDEIWEDASDNDTDDAGLAYGGRQSAGESRESLVSEQGTSKWAWRWDKNKDKRVEKARQRREPFERKDSAAYDTFNNLASAGSLGVAAATLSHEPSPTTIPPMRHIDPVPTSESTPTQGSQQAPRVYGASSGKFASTSPVPLEQPQPISPIAAQPARLAKFESAERFSESPEIMEPRERRSRAEFESRELSKIAQRDTSPVDSPINPSAFRRSSVAFHLTAEQLENESRAMEKEERRRMKREKQKWRMSADTEGLQQDLDSDLSGRRRSSSMGTKSARDLEIEAELKQLHAELKRQKAEKRRAAEERQAKVADEIREGKIDEPSMQNSTRDEIGGSTTSAVITAAAIAAGAGLATATLMKDRKEASSGEEDGKSRRKSGLKRDKDAAVDGQEESQQERIARMVEQRTKTVSPVYEDYSKFFTPEDIAEHVNEHNAAAQHRDDTSINIIEAVPGEMTSSSRRLAPFDPDNYRPFGLDPDDDPLRFPWRVPLLGLIEPTPPHSRLHSPRAPLSPLVSAQEAVQEDGEPLDRESSKATSDDHDTHVGEAHTPEYERGSRTNEFQDGKIVQIDSQDQPHNDSPDVEAYYRESKPENDLEQTPEDFYRPGVQRVYTLDDDAEEATIAENSGNWRKPRERSNTPPRGGRVADVPTDAPEIYIEEREPSFMDSDVLHEGSVTDFASTERVMAERPNKSEQRRKERAATSEDTQASGQGQVVDFNYRDITSRSGTMPGGFDIEDAHREASPPANADAMAAMRQAAQAAAAAAVRRQKSTETVVSGDEQISNVSAGKSRDSKQRSNTSKKRSDVEAAGVGLATGILAAAALQTEPVAQDTTTSLESEPDFYDTGNDKIKNKRRASRRLSEQDDYHHDQYEYEGHRSEDSTTTAQNGDERSRKRLERDGEHTDEHDSVSRDTVPRKQSTDDGFVSAEDGDQPDRKRGDSNATKRQSFLGDRPEMPQPMVLTDTRMGTDGVSGLENTKGVQSEQVKDDADNMMRGPTSREVESYEQGLGSSIPAATSVEQLVTSTGPESPVHTRSKTLTNIQTGGVGFSPVVTSSPTAVPLHFRRPPITPRASRDVASSPIVSPHSPLSAPRSRQSRPKSTEFTHKEVRPLYLVERINQAKVISPEVEETYPSLPSSRTTSANPSTEDLRGMMQQSSYFPASGEAGMSVERGRRHSWQDTRDLGQSLEYLDSRSATPVPGEKQRARELRERRELPKHLFHSPSELLQDPAHLQGLHEDDMELPSSSPLPSVASTEVDQNYMSAESGVSTPAEDRLTRSKSEPSPRETQQMGPRSQSPSSSRPRSSSVVAKTGLGLLAGVALGTAALNYQHGEEEDRDQRVYHEVLSPPEPTRPELSPDDDPLNKQPVSPVEAQAVLSPAGDVSNESAVDDLTTEVPGNAISVEAKEDQDLPSARELHDTIFQSQQQRSDDETQVQLGDSRNVSESTTMRAGDDILAPQAMDYRPIEEADVLSSETPLRDSPPSNNLDTKSFVQYRGLFAQSPVDPSAFDELPKLQTGQLFIPSAEQINAAYNDLGAFELAFERAVRSRGLHADVTREEAMNTFLPKRNNAPFMPKGDLTPIGEQSANNSPASQSAVASPAEVTTEGDKGLLSKKSKKLKRKEKKLKRGSKLRDGFSSEEEAATPDSVQLTPISASEGDQKRENFSVDEEDGGNHRDEEPFSRPNPFGDDFEIPANDVPTLNKVKDEDFHPLHEEKVVDQDSVSTAAQPSITLEEDEPRGELAKELHEIQEPPQSQHQEFADDVEPRAMTTDEAEPRKEQADRDPLQSTDLAKTDADTVQLASENIPEPAEVQDAEESVWSTPSGKKGKKSKKGKKRQTIDFTEEGVAPALAVAGVTASDSAFFDKEKQNDRPATSEEVAATEPSKNIDDNGDEPSAPTSTASDRAVDSIADPTSAIQETTEIEHVVLPQVEERVPWDFGLDSKQKKKKEKQMRKAKTWDDRITQEMIDAENATSAELDLPDSEVAGANVPNLEAEVDDLTKGDGKGADDPLAEDEWAMTSKKSKKDKKKKKKSLAESLEPDVQTLEPETERDVSGDTGDQSAITTLPSEKSSQQDVPEIAEFEGDLQEVNLEAPAPIGLATKAEPGGSEDVVSPTVGLDTSAVRTESADPDAWMAPVKKSKKDKKKKKALFADNEEPFTVDESSQPQQNATEILAESSAEPSAAKRPIFDDLHIDNSDVRSKSIDDVNEQETGPATAEDSNITPTDFQPTDQHMVPTEPEPEEEFSWNAPRKSKKGKKPRKSSNAEPEHPTEMSIESSKDSQAPQANIVEDPTAESTTVDPMFPIEGDVDDNDEITVPQSQLPETGEEEWTVPVKKSKKDKKKRQLSLQATTEPAEEERQLQPEIELARPDNLESSQENSVAAEDPTPVKDRKLSKKEKKKLKKGKAFDLADVEESEKPESDINPNLESSTLPETENTEVDTFALDDRTEFGTTNVLEEPTSFSAVELHSDPQHQNFLSEIKKEASAFPAKPIAFESAHFGNEATQQKSAVEGEREGESNFDKANLATVTHEKHVDPFDDIAATSEDKSQTATEDNFTAAFSTTEDPGTAESPHKPTDEPSALVTPLDKDETFTSERLGRTSQTIPENLDILSDLPTSTAYTEQPKDGQTIHVIASEEEKVEDMQGAVESTKSDAQDLYLDPKPEDVASAFEADVDDLQAAHVLNEPVVPQGESDSATKNEEVSALIHDDHVADTSKDLHLDQNVTDGMDEIAPEATSMEQEVTWDVPVKKSKKDKKKKRATVVSDNQTAGDTSMEVQSEETLTNQDAEDLKSLEPTASVVEPEDEWSQPVKKSKKDKKKKRGSQVLLTPEISQSTSREQLASEAQDPVIQSASNTMENDADTIEVDRQIMPETATIDDPEIRDSFIGDLSSEPAVAHEDTIQEPEDFYRNAVIEDAATHLQAPEPLPAADPLSDDFSHEKAVSIAPKHPASSIGNEIRNDPHETENSVGLESSRENTYLAETEVISTAQAETELVDENSGHHVLSGTHLEPNVLPEHSVGDKHPMGGIEDDIARPETSVQEQIDAEPGDDATWSFSTKKSKKDKKKKKKRQSIPGAFDSTEDTPVAETPASLTEPSSPLSKAAAEVPANIPVIEQIPLNEESNIPSAPGDLLDEQGYSFTTKKSKKEKKKNRKAKSQGDQDQIGSREVESQDQISYEHADQPEVYYRDQESFIPDEPIEQHPIERDTLLSESMDVDNEFEPFSRRGPEDQILDKPGSEVGPPTGETMREMSEAPSMEAGHRIDPEPVEREEEWTVTEKKGKKGKKAKKQKKDKTIPFDVVGQQLAEENTNTLETLHENLSPTRQFDEGTGLASHEAPISSDHVEETVHQALPEMEPDSDTGSNVSEATRERRRRRKSPPIWSGEEPEDLPHSPRDRALTPPPEQDDIMDTALGIAAGLGFGASSSQHPDTSHTRRQAAPSTSQNNLGWSFADVPRDGGSVRDSGVQFEESPTVPQSDSHHSIRDSGYVTSPIIHEKHGYDTHGLSDSVGSSLRPARPRSPTSSVEDVSNTRATHGGRGHLHETPSRRHPSPIEPTTKDRDSGLFKSSPAVATPISHGHQNERLETPMTDLHRSPSIHGHRSSSREERKSSSGSPRVRRTSDELSSSLLNRAAAMEVDREVFSPSPQRSLERALSPTKRSLHTIDENGVAMAVAGGLGAAALLSRDRPDLSHAKSLGQRGLSTSPPNLADPTTLPSDSNFEPSSDQPSFHAHSADRSASMADVYDGYGAAPGSPRSPSRPPSLRKRQSLQQISDLQARVEQLASENRQLAEQKLLAERHIEDLHLEHSKADYATQEALETLNAQLRERDEEITKLRTELDGLIAARDTLRDEHDHKYTMLLNEKDTAHAQWQESTRELDALRGQHHELSTGMEDIIQTQLDAAVAVKDTEIQKLRRDLEKAREKIRELQSQILSRGVDEVVTVHDEVYFDNACKQLCQHVQQWVLRFSKFSDTRVCRTTHQVRDEKVVDRFDAAVLDGSDVDVYLADRVKRRDVFMSVVMAMIWEHVFTRYLFGMDRDQRQKLKQLEKNLSDVGPAGAVHQWRALTLTLLSKRAAFKSQREDDLEAVATEVMQTLSKFLPPPSNAESQLYESLRNVVRSAVNLSIEMRTQKAEFVMLPPEQPEYDTNGDIAKKVYFDAKSMNERSGDFTSNDEPEQMQAVVRMVLFPVVVRRADGSHSSEQDIIVCPAQVLVAKQDKGKRPKSRITSGDHSDRAQSRMSTSDGRSMKAASTHSLGAMSGVITGEGNMF